VRVKIVSRQPKEASDVEAPPHGAKVDSGGTEKPGQTLSEAADPHSSPSSSSGPPTTVSDMMHMSRTPHATGYRQIIDKCQGSAPPSMRVCHEQKWRHSDRFEVRLNDAHVQARRLANRTAAWLTLGSIFFILFPPSTRVQKGFLQVRHSVSEQTLVGIHTMARYTTSLRVPSC
jgi:hypothetical protein